MRYDEPRLVRTSLSSPDHAGCACFPWFLSFVNRTQNSRVAVARPNPGHQPIEESRAHPGRGSLGSENASFPSPPKVPPIRFYHEVATVLVLQNK
jgi:hypothetical protein